MEIVHKFMKFLRSNFALSNLPIIIALILLASSPFFILQKGIVNANQVASYALYFLILGILWKAIQYSISIYRGKDNVSSKSLDSKT